MFSFVLLVALCLPALARDHDGNYGNHWGCGDSRDSSSDFRGVPGPVAGAGLPIIAVGYGVYWLIRRRRRTPEQ